MGQENYLPELIRLSQERVAELVADRETLIELRRQVSSEQSFALSNAISHMSAAIADEQAAIATYKRRLWTVHGIKSEAAA